MMKKFIALAVTAIMTIGSVVTVSAATFYDINDVPWEGAKEYINSVSDLGLMVGDTDSSGRKVFRANDRITYCEVMQLAYSVLKNAGAMENSADTVSKWKSIMQAAYIPEWAYNCVSYGLENGILSENDVTIFMKGEGVSRNATRENVAVIFGKAIEHLSAINSSAVLTYNDKDKVAATSVPYVDLLSRLSIIVGDDSGNFNPKYYINRAEMAVMTSKTYYEVSELEEEKNTQTQTQVDTLSGTVILTDDGSSSKTIAVSDTETGTVSSFTINSTTLVIDSEGASKSYSDISIGDVITVSSMNGVVTSVVLNEDNNSSAVNEKDNVLTGYMNNITSSAITFDTEDGEQEWYELASNIKFYLNGGQVSKDDLYEYAVGRNVMKVEVKLNSNGYVEEVDAELCDVKGTVSSISEDAVYINFEYAGKSKKIKCIPTSTCDYYFEGDETSESKMEDLLEDNKLYAVADINNFGKAERIDFYYDTYKTGTLESISSSDIEFKTRYGKTVEYEYDDDVEFTLNGEDVGYRAIKNKFASSDILVSIELSDDELVTKVDAKELNIKGTLVTADTSRIVVVDDDTRIVLPIDSGIECTFNGESVSYSSMKKLVSEEENVMLVEAEMDEEDYTVVKMTVVSGTDNEGVVSSFSGSEITFVNSIGIEYTYKVEPAAIGYIDGEYVSSLSSAREAAFVDGSTIKVTFSSRGYVNRVYVITESN